MSNKDWGKLNELDRTIRSALPVGMNDGVHLTIEYFSGFELFNTRPYHNYETWSAGYRVKGKGITIEEEDLDDAIKQWANKYKEQEDRSDLTSNGDWYDDGQEGNR